MPTLDDLANEQTTATASETIPNDGLQEFQDNYQQNSRIQEIFNKFLTAETGSGAIGDYIDHPMNFNSSKGLARILRGFTGMFGSLSLAIIDVALGTLEFSKERKAVVNNDISNGGGFPS